MDIKTDDLWLMFGDCLEKMKEIPNGSVDMVLTDPPYGTTACKWDSVILLEPMWEQLKRIIKPNGAIVMTASQPFTSVLVCSNLSMFKHEWVWEKSVGSNFANLKYQPMKEHESVIVFSKSTVNYYPVMQERKGTQKGVCPDYTNTHSPSKDKKGETTRSIKRNRDGKSYGELRNPSSVQFFNNRIKSDRGLHPTQKPVALMEYLIKTYTNEGETVLDFTMGSGTTGVACRNLTRKFIGIEMDDTFYNIAVNRIKENLT
jgi:site-specific DNA-methyltransferase (adenine-specific)